MDIKGKKFRIGLVTPYIEIRKFDKSFIMVGPT